MGGESKKTFRSQNFRKLLIDNHKYPLEKQREILEQTYEAWKGENEQIDDILVIGIKMEQ